MLVWRWSRAANSSHRVTAARQRVASSNHTVLPCCCNPSCYSTYLVSSGVMNGAELIHAVSPITWTLELSLKVSDN